MSSTDRVTVREVGLRDGLQMVRHVVPTTTKLDWCRAQAGCGFNEIEVTSFVPPSILPQFTDAPEVLRAAQAIDGLKASVLVPNIKGGVRALKAGAKKITFVLSASEAHNRANVRRSTDASAAEFAALAHERDQCGLRHEVELSAIIATAFGCSIQGKIAEDRVTDLALTLAEAGADEVNIADTVGYADPVQVKRLLCDIHRHIAPLPLAAHFHDTRGMGLANVMAALEAGVRRFDAALGGLGGCPFAPGATGNIATEDCVYMLEAIALNTGIDLNALLVLRRRLDDWVPGERIEGKLSRAGPAITFQACYGD